MITAVSYDLSTGLLGVLYPGIPKLEDCPTLEGCGVMELPQGAKPSDYLVDVSATPHALVQKSDAEINTFNLDTEKAECLACLADKVELEQSRHLTKNKEFIYRAKEAEVVHYEAATLPVDSDYPFAQQHVLDNGGTVADAIGVFKARAADTKLKLVALDAVELATKNAIVSATELGQPKQILAAATWPSPE